MGKVQQIDHGEAGKLYFLPPTLIEIPTKHKHETTSYSSSYGTTTGIPIGPGQCRLKSSHNQGSYKPPSDCEYLLSKYPNKMDVDAYLQIHKGEGWWDGAIVTRKYQPIDAMHKVYKWGVVMLVSRHIGTSEYAPYLIKWFNDGCVEHAWAEDLLLIHAAIDEDICKDILEEQGVGYFGRESPV